MSKMERWIGKVAIVTGASSGIGKAIATRLTVEGMIVAGLARRKEKLDELVSSLKGQKGQFHAIKTDISKDDDILKAFEYIGNKLGSIHVLINNAGIGRVASLTSGKTKHWRDILETNVIGLSIATREAFQNMKANHVNGHIIHINSITGHSISKVYMEMYSASKHAVAALTAGLRQELNMINSKIKITSISPGWVKGTEMMESTLSCSEGTLPQQNQSLFTEEYPKLELEDMADCVVYVLGTPSHVQIQEVFIRPIGDVI